MSPELRQMVIDRDEVGAHCGVYLATGALARKDLLTAIFANQATAADNDVAGNFLLFGWLPPWFI
jgi:hypothetical protein